MEEVLIGVDAGTTNIKSIAMDPSGSQLYVASRENPVQTPAERWIEQDMETTWRLTAETIREVVEQIPDSRPILGVGITAQGDGCWLIDENGEPARDAILWSDGRSSEIIEEWIESGTAASVTDICGSDLFPGSTLSILAWLAEQEPNVLDRADTIFYCKDWLKYRLTGTRTSDPSDMSMPFLDIESGTYAKDVFEMGGVGDLEALLPRIANPSEIVGTVTEPAAKTTGLPTGTPVVSGALDIVACAYGSGAVEPGDSSSVVGTTSLNQTILEDPPLDTDGTGFSFALGNGQYSRALASMAGTPNLDWAFEEFTDNEKYQDVIPRLEEIPIGSEGVCYHPYLSVSGERSPFLKTNARASFLGLSPDHTNDHLLRAVYEGVTLAMRDCYEHMPGDPDRILMSGGGARSDFWCQLFADCLDTQIAVPKGDEYGAKGAALLAGVGSDIYEDLESAVRKTTKIERTYEPVPENTQQYNIWYDHFRSSYESLFDVWDDRSRSMTELERCR
ncbi:FGGY-family carbohydrate kinase [Natronococcus occultus]|uniref:Pentulose/hexulose kinase n=1 Tax=Natronococcus occultus SP4 TaxID=694430 RepID=L0JVN5_9EURY|nr:FGGY-family carbohydrate kinase [Natronococcus occultus]AGB37097.1 pentulose/hexulose kinase [Natronococcus occultus SP4]